jgi:hypothetical protein
MCQLNCLYYNVEKHLKSNHMKIRTNKHLDNRFTADNFKQSILKIETIYGFILTNTLNV